MTRVEPQVVDRGSQGCDGAPNRLLLPAFGEVKGYFREPETSQGTTTGEDLEDDQIIIPVPLVNFPVSRDTQVQRSDVLESWAFGDEVDALSEAADGVNRDVSAETA